ncbi:hypothetical protein HERIO_2381 [Hepatospora eriocheir]|uniref:Uncharacterized protein n=1 Tax=Hepatospora eriocheir TaxID=1081669 RepID=A0A1X0Q741_9MICR|nr:hypothetical protein HERIO_2381 [Hepatospora eriocheir]
MKLYLNILNIVSVQEKVSNTKLEGFKEVSKTKIDEMSMKVKGLKHKIKCKLSCGDFNQTDSDSEQPDGRIVQKRSGINQ